MTKKKKKDTLVFKNRKVYFDYEILNKFEVGIVLQGTEVKSIRNGKVSLVGTYCYFNDKNELLIKDMDIAIYDEGSYNNHDTKQDRKLLMHKHELLKLREKYDEKGYSIVPLKLYPNERNIFKLEIGLAKGRKTYDKRKYIADRENKRELKDIMNN